MPGPKTSSWSAAAVALAVGLTATGPSLAQALPDYSARAVHVLPDGTQSDGRVVKSGANMRFEYDEAGRDVVQIVRQAEGVIFFIDPASQSFFEVQGPPSSDATGAGYLPPCQDGDPAVSCTKTGTAVTSGITAEVWEMTQTGQQGVTTILWDGLRRRALQQSYPDGTVVTTTFQAMEVVSGRNVEHWVITVAPQGQPSQSGDWFYDPELRVEVREVMPTGEIRSLEDIQVGPVDPASFQVPAGYTRMEMPAPPEQ